MEENLKLNLVFTGLQTLSANCQWLKRRKTLQWKNLIYTTLNKIKVHTTNIVQTDIMDSHDEVRTRYCFGDLRLGLIRGVTSCSRQEFPETHSRTGWRQKDWRTRPLHGWKPLPLKVQGSMWKRRQEDHGSQRWWTLRKHCSRHNRAGKHTISQRL